MNHQNNPTTRSAGWSGGFVSRKGTAAGRRCEPGFTCCHCRREVNTQHEVSGVHNRNHCPLCLWSRHLDLRQPGDRLAACKSPMQPVGLTMKRSAKKYGSSLNGELMLIHRCVDCQKLSVNRIAADDAPYLIEALVNSAGGIAGDLQEQLLVNGITPLTQVQLQRVRLSIFGFGS